MNIATRFFGWLLLFVLIFFCRKTRIVQYPWFKLTELLSTVKTADFVSKKKLVQTYFLDNGLKVVLLKDPQASKVLVSTAWKVGSANETDKSRGIAHLLEHMFFKGTHKMSEVDVRKIGTFYGANYNALTFPDMTYYYFEVGKDEYKPFLEILADCSQNLRCDQQMLYSEFQVVVNELKMRMDSPDIFAQESIFKSIFGQKHPYSTPVIGYVKDLFDVDQKSLLKFYKEHYRMDNGTLFVIGNFNELEAKEQIEKSFGAFAKSSGKPAEVQFPSVLDLQKHVIKETVVHHNVAQPKVYLSWAIPGVSDSKLSLIGDVCSNYIGCSDGNLNNNVFLKHKELFKSINVSTSPGFANNVFSIVFSCDKENIDKCTEIVKAELKSIIDKGLWLKEFFRAKLLVKSAYTNIIPVKGGSVSMAGLGISIALNTLAAGYSGEDFFDCLKIVDQIYSTDAEDFFRDYLHPDFCARNIVLPLDQDSKQAFEKEQAEFSKATDKLLKSRVRKTPIEEPRVAKELLSSELAIAPFPKPTKTLTLSNGIQVLAMHRPESKNVNGILSSLDFEWIKHSIMGDVFYSLANALLFDNHNKKNNNDGFIKNLFGASFTNTNISFAGPSENFNSVFKHTCSLIKNRCAKSEDITKMSKLGFINNDSFIKNPAMVANRTRANLLYKGTDFCWTFEQAKELCQNLKLEQIENAWREFFVPQKLVLILVGNLPSGWEALVEKELGSLKDERVEKKDHTIPQISCVKGLAEKISLPTNQNSLLFVRANQLAANDFKRFALDLINKIVLSGAQGSAIFKIREAKGLFYNAGGQLGSNFNQSHSFDFISAFLAAENVKPFKKELWNMIKEFCVNGVDESALFIAKKNVLKEFETVFAQDASLATSLLSMKINNLEPDFYDRAMEYLKNLSLQEFNQIVKEYCTDEGWATIEVGKIGQ